MRRRINLNLFAIIMVAGIFVGCAPSIKRIGYPKPKQVVTSCPMEFLQMNQTPKSDSVQKLGEVKVRDGGFTFKCTESDILDIVRTETCSLGGNIAVIKKEKKPDWLSSCYRAEADILRVKDSALAADDSGHYKKENIENRSAKNSATQTAMLIGAVVGGLVAGFLVSR